MLIEVYSHVKNLIVLSSKLAAFPRTCKGSISFLVLPTLPSPSSTVFLKFPIVSRRCRPRFLENLVTWPLSRLHASVRVPDFWRASGGCTQATSFNFASFPQTEASIFGTEVPRTLLEEVRLKDFNNKSTHVIVFSDLFDLWVVLT